MFHALDKTVYNEDKGNSFANSSIDRKKQVDELDYL